MSYPYYDLVQKAYNELVSEGKIKPLPPGNQEAVEEQKGLLTQRSGYYSNLRDNQIGVLEKTSGNNYKGYSVDILIHKNGTFWDIATDDGRQALPVNGGPAGPDPDLSARWRQPTKELAGLENGNGNGEEPPPDILAILNEILAKQDVLIHMANQQTEILNQHTVMLQQIIDKPTGDGSQFPITYPTYSFRDLLGRIQTMQPQPPKNPGD